jgi:hypothetical protein
MGRGWYCIIGYLQNADRLQLAHFRSKSSNNNSSGLMIIVRRMSYGSD